MKASFATILLVNLFFAAPTITEANDIGDPRLKGIATAVMHFPARRGDLEFTVGCAESMDEKRVNYDLLYNESLPPTKQWRLTNIDNQRELNRIKSSLSDRPAPATYADVMKFVGDTPELISEDSKMLLVRANKLGRQAVVINGKDVSEHFYAEITVAKQSDGYLAKNIKFHLKSPFSIGIAKVVDANGEMEFVMAQGIDFPVLSRSVFNGVFRLFLSEKTTSKEEIYSQYRVINR